MKGVKGFVKGRVVSKETRMKISKALSREIKFNCDYCGEESTDKPSSYDRKKRHFCCMDCYSMFRKNLLPKHEQPAYKNGGMSESDKRIRVKARSDLNHAVRSGKIKREPCRICGEEKSEGHHTDYSKPLIVIWLCNKHHHEAHSNPELIEA